jgi:hypothetical protein
MNQGIYLYGIAKGEVAHELLAAANPALYAIPALGYSAIVSNRVALGVGELDRESLARLLLEHQKSLEALMKCGVQLIPVKLGTFVFSGADAAGIIENGFNLITALFSETDNACEMEVVVKWSSFPKLLQEIAAGEEVQALKREIDARPQPTKEDAISIGRLMKAKIDERNATVGAELLERLAADASRAKRHEVMDDEMVLNAAFLVLNSQLDAFVASVEELDRQYGDALNFRIVGPLPCYSFSSLEVREITAEAVAEARRLLELDVAAGQEEIRKAFRAKAMATHPDHQEQAGNADGAEFAAFRVAYTTLVEYCDALDNTAAEPHNGLPARFFSVKTLN